MAMPLLLVQTRFRATSNVHVSPNMFPSLDAHIMLVVILRKVGRATFDGIMRIKINTLNVEVPTWTLKRQNRNPTTLNYFKVSIRDDSTELLQKGMLENNTDSTTSTIAIGPHHNK